MAFRFREQKPGGIRLDLAESPEAPSYGRCGTRYLPAEVLKKKRADAKAARRLGLAGRRRLKAKALADDLPAKRIRMSFFRRLFVPDEEERFIDGCRELAAGNMTAAYDLFLHASPHADTHFMCGFLALRHAEYQKAIHFLEESIRKHREMGKGFGRHGIRPQVLLPITAEVVALVEADLRGALLGKVEACQRLGRWNDAAEALEQLIAIDPKDVVSLVSLAEIMTSEWGKHMNGPGRVVELTEGVRNLSEVHAALMLYRARALSLLGRHRDARKLLSAALRKKVDRSPEIRRALRIERAHCYRALGEERKARDELEKAGGGC